MEPTETVVPSSRRVRALLRHCCHGHCSPGGGHACDRPPALELDLVADPGRLESIGPLHTQVQARLREVSGYPVTLANTVRLLLDGTQSYTAMLDLVDFAREEILFENFILRADALGLAFMGELRRRAGEGVGVQILHDPLGSRFSTIRIAFRFRGSAAQVRLYNPPRPTRAFFRRGRDHRKLVVQDGGRLVAGGMCLADLWVGNCVSRCTWRDSAIWVEGEAVAQASGEFATMWGFGVPLSHRAPGKQGCTPAEDSRGDRTGQVPVRIVADGPRGRCAEQILLEVFGAARHEILITNSYFVPPPPLVAALVASAQRGVGVELLIPRSSDHPLVDLAAEHLLGELLQAGVKVWHWTGPMIHAKTVVVDRCWSLVGSSNLDSFSLRRNAELNVEVHGSRVGEQMVEIFLHDCSGSVALTYAEWKDRSLRRRWLARLAASVGGWM